VRTRIRSGAGEPGGPRRPSLATLVFRQWGRSGSAGRDRLEIRRLCPDPRQEPHRVIDQDARRPGDRDILIEREQLSLDRAEHGRARPSSGAGVARSRARRPATCGAMVAADPDAPWPSTKIGAPETGCMAGTIARRRF